MAPASVRTKNPGAMWPGPIPTKWNSKRWIYLNDGTGQGGNGHGNKIAIFEAFYDGICAQLDLWRTSKNYRNKRLYDALRVWSGGNSVQAYVNYVCKRIPGMTADTIMNDAFWKGPQGLAFLKAQAAHEAGLRDYPAAPDDWTKAQARVMSGVPTVDTVKKAGGSTAGGVASGTLAGVQDGLPIEWALGIGLAIAVAIFLVWKFRPFVSAEKKAAAELPHPDVVKAALAVAAADQQEPQPIV